MRRLCISIVLAAVAILLIAVPALAGYYAYIQVEETDGNSYDDLPLICSTNVSQLAQYGFITSTGLTSRVLTGSGYALPHMLADDKILFVTDLDAFEEKSLIFYPKGATSLSSFPIIVGYDGYITTPDDPDLELTYVMQALYSGRFDSSAGEGKYVHYKEDAWKVWISDDDEISVAGLSAGDVEEWTMSYDSFTSGLHTVYVVADGMDAYLYVDGFVTPKDTESLWENSSQLLETSASIYNSYMGGRQHYTFYANGRYWCFYLNNSSVIAWRSSTDGDSWAAEQTVAAVVGDSVSTSFSVWFRGSYCHIAYGGKRDGTDYVRYRRGTPGGDGNIAWCAAWQTAATADNIAKYASIAVDDDGYPFIIYRDESAWKNTDITASSANDGTWVTAGGYPWQITNDGDGGIFSYYDTDDMFMLYTPDSSNYLYSRYYNGSSWAAAQTICSTMACANYDAVSDDDGNMYIVWEKTTGGPGVHFRVRYAGGSLSSITTISSDGQHPCVSYNPETDGVYIFYEKGNSYIYGYVLIGGTLIGEYQFSAASTGVNYLTSTPYTNNIGIATYSVGGYIDHQYLSYPWGWNDNANDWTWMQNNVMPYADDLLVAIDGTIQLEYEPAAIIQGTTLPDEQSDHDGIITWGSNPGGVDASISSMQSDEQEGVYYYPYDGSGSQDIIEPEPAEMTTDVDLARLEDNPLSPLVHLIADASGGQLTLRLVWMGLAWLILIVAMLLVHLGPDTHKDSVRPQHFVLTSLTGLGLSILFYSVGIFPLWVPILLAFGLIASIVYERMPVL